MVEWGDGEYADTVQGYVPMARVQRIDLLLRDELMQEVTRLPVLRAIDGWDDPETPREQD